MDQNMETPTPEENPQQQPPQPPGQPEVAPIEGLSKEAKQWAMFCHLSALSQMVGVPFGMILGPLIIWLIKKDDFEFVRDQGREALNFQISVYIYMLVCLPLICLGGLGVVLMVIIAIVDMVFVIIASIKVSDGIPYTYPLTIRFIK